MKRFWISWWQPTEDERPLTFPPSAAILGWWNSGQGGDGWSLCAVVCASDEFAAKAAVAFNWPEAQKWRFCNEVAPGFQPGDRFPLSEWMKERF